MSDGITKALAIAVDAHKDQKDKAGAPYIWHPVTVALHQTTEAGVIVALLHDVVEDSHYTEDDLRKAGYSDDVLNAVHLLTHKKGVSYFDYVQAIKENETARSVKIQDLRHNSDLSRLKSITDKDIERAEKYKQALDILA